MVQPRRGCYERGGMHLRRCALALALTLSVGCLNPRTLEQAPRASEPAPVVSAQAPTGNYGQVKGVELSDVGIEAFKLQGKTERAAAAMVAVEGQPFARALRVEVKEKSGNPWDVQLQQRVEKPVQVGDVILATLYLKAEASRE